MAGVLVITPATILNDADKLFFKSLLLIKNDIIIGSIVKTMPYIKMDRLNTDNNLAPAGIPVPTKNSIRPKSRTVSI